MPFSQLYLFEKGFGYDLDGDSFQGSPYVSLSLKASASQGRVKFDDSLRLLRTNLTSNLYQHPINRNYYVGPSSDRAIPLKVNNSQGLIQNSGELLTTRSLLSVGQSDDGINVALLRENTTPSLDWPFVVAQFDSNWRFISYVLGYK